MGSQEPPTVGAFGSGAARRKPRSGKEFGLGEGFKGRLREGGSKSRVSRGFWRAVRGRETEFGVQSGMFVSRSGAKSRVEASPEDEVLGNAGPEKWPPGSPDRARGRESRRPLPAATPLAECGDASRPERARTHERLRPPDIYLSDLFRLRSPVVPRRGLLRHTRFRPGLPWHARLVLCSGRWSRPLVRASPP